MREQERGSTCCCQRETPEAADPGNVKGAAGEFDRGTGLQQSKEARDLNHVRLHSFAL